MPSMRFLAIALVGCALPFLTFSQPATTPSGAYHVQDKIASSDQGVEREFGTTLAMEGDVLVASDQAEHVEIHRRNMDGSWSLEAVLSAPDAGTDFGMGGYALATNGEWVAVGASGDDTFGTNAGAVHMYHFDGLDWQYEGKLSHMAPFGNIGYDNFGMSVAMDGERMVMGSKAENPMGGKGAIHYFEYNAWLDMWLETGFVASTHSTGGSTTRFAQSIDISGDYLIAGEYGNPDNGALAGAAHLFRFYNQCWHLEMTFLGHEPGDRLGTDVGISGNRAAAGSPEADLDGNTQGGAVTLYELLDSGSGDMAWSETHHFAPAAVGSWDRFGGALDLDGDMLVVGAARDDENGTNAGIGYFIFDCNSATLECVSEGLACDSQDGDRFGQDVAASSGLAAIGARLDDNIFGDAGSVYVLGGDDLGFECDLTAPAAPVVDLVDESDTGIDEEDNITRHTSPDFDVFLPGGGSMSLMDGAMAHAGDALVWTLDGSGESDTLILTQNHIDDGFITLQFIYPGPVLPDGEYTYCATLIDVFGNVGPTGCLDIIIDNEDPEPMFEGGADYDTSNTDDYGVYLPGASSPEDCEALAGLSGGVWDGTYTDAESNMITPGCYIVNGGTNPSNVYQWQSYAALMPDTTLYLDATGSAMLDLSASNNISATDNIGLDTLFAEPITFDCDDAGTLVPVTLTAIDIAGNIGTITIQVEVLDDAAPDMLASDYTLELDAAGSGILTTADIDNGSSDNCGITTLTLSQTAFDCSHVGANSVTMTATDPSGNTSSVTVTVMVEDNIAPIASASDTTLYLDATGEVTLDFSEIAGNSSDACGIASDAALQAGPVAPLMPVAGQLLVPGNDDCANATAVGEGTFAFDNTGASTDGPTDRDPNMALDVWFLYTPSADGTASINTCGSPGSLDDTVIILYDGSSCPSAGDIGLVSDDDGCTSPNFASAVDLAVSASNTYLIQLGGWNGGQGDGELYIELEADPSGPTGPANDDCADATPVGEGTFAFDNTGASTDGPTDGDPNMALDVWFLYTPSADGTASINTCGSPGSLDDTVIILYDGSSCPSAGDIGLVSDDDGCTSPNFASTVDLAVSASNTYLIQLGGWNGAQGDGELYIELEAAPSGPANDECANAIAVGEGTFAFDNTGANTDGPTDADANMANDVWFLYSPAADGTATIHTCGSPGSLDDTVIILYDGSSCPSAGDSGLASDDDGCSSPIFNSSITLEVSASNSYLIQLGGWNGAQGDGELYIELTAPEETWTFTCSDVGVTPFEYIATDVNGNESTDPFSVTVLDTISPIVITQAVTLTLDASGNATLAAAQVDNGSSDACGIIDVSLSQTAFDCSHLGSNTVTMTVTDTNGNSASADATITVVDAEPPVAIAQDLTVQLDASGAATITADDIDNGSYDDCSGVASITLDETTFDCTDVGAPITVTLTVTDVSGNTANATATVTVEDNVAPTALVQDLTLQLDAAGAATATAADVDNGSSDACGIASLSISQENFDCSDLGANTLVFTATDVNGNTTTATFTVTVQDNETPVISGMPANITQTADAGNCSAAVSWTAPTASDNCTPTLTSTHSSGDTFGVGTTTVTYTATDAAGNTTSSSFNVTVTDNEDPAISGMPSDITQTNDAGNCSAAVSWTAPTASDNCAVSSLTSTHNSGDAFPVGATTVSYTATDINGNTTTSTFTVTVTDDEAPAISGMPANISQNADAGACTTDVTWTAPTASDNCGVTSFTSDYDSGDTFSIGTTTVTYTATDAAGNTTTSTFTVTISEVEAPTISGMPADISQTADAGQCSAAVTWTEPTASDNCNVASFTSTHSPGAAFAVGTTTVTYTATDGSGNTTTASFTVTVTDDEAPSLSGTPANITQTNDAGNCSAVVSWTDPTGADNCAIATLTSSHNSGDTFLVGSTTVSFTAADINGNTTTGTFTVTVTDDEDPTISGMPADIALNNDAGNCSAVASWTEPTAADNCGVTSWTSSHDSGDAFPVGSTTVSYTATDAAGNTTTSTFTVTVTDNEAPAISGMPGDLTQSNDAGNCSAAVSWTAPTAADNCAIASFSSDIASGSTFNVGTTTVTYTAIDIHGNQTTASFTVTVTDDESPSITGTPSDISQTNDAGNCSAAVTWTAPTAADNCGVTSFTSTHNPGDAFAVGTTTVTYTAMDAAGNSSTTSFNVVVSDDEDPAISGMPADIASNNDTGNCSAVASWTAPTASDNCAIDTFTWSHDSGDAFPVGSTTVSYTATDIHGNTTTSTFTVTVTDNEAPTISGMPNDLTQTNDAGDCSAAVSWTAPTAADNCAIATFSSDIASGSTFNVGTTTVTYTATDIHGNQATASFTVTVTDDEAPSITGTPANITQSNDAGECEAEVSWTAPTAADNCGVISWTSTYDTGDTFPVGTTTVTYTAMDAAGNSSSSSFTVTVTDDEDPVITVEASDLTYERDGNEDVAFSNWLAANGGAAATDNCGLSGWSNDSEGLSDDCGSTGSETVTFTATDIHGNSSTTSATFTVVDGAAPSCPLIDLTDGSDLGLSSTDNLTSDNTPTMRVMFTGSGVESAEAGDVVELYTFGILTESYTIDQTDVDNGYAEFETGPFSDGPVMFSARHIDDCGQASIFAFLNIIVHSTAPTAAADGLTLYLDPDGNVSIEAEDLDDGSSDDFNVVSFSADQTEFGCDDLGDNTVTLTVTDVAGNTATATDTVTVIDDVDPVITPMDITVQLDAAGAATITATDVASAEDNCTVASMTIDITSFDCSNVGDVTVTISATDQSGNSSSATATVTVEDNVPPTVMLIDTVLYLDSDGLATLAGEDLDDGSSDACGIAGFAIGVPGTEAPAGQMLLVPGNDDCANATAVGEGTFAFDNTGASTDGPTDRDPNMALDVWFLYTPSADGTASINTCGSPGSLDDTVIILYDGSSCPSAGDIGLVSDDDGCTSPNFASAVDLAVSASNTYLIQLGGWNGGQGDGELYIELEADPSGPTGPANDDCADATPVGEGTFAFDNTGASTDGPTDGDPNMALDVWFLYTPSADGTASINTCGSPGSLDDTVIILYDGSSCPSAGDIGLVSDDDGCTSPNFASTVDLAVSASNTYLIQLGGWNGAQGDGELYIELEAAPSGPANDECANAIAVGEGTFAFDNTGANTDGPTDADANMANDVWFLYTPTADGTATIHTCGSPGSLDDTVIILYDGSSCPSAGDAGLASDDDGCSSPIFNSSITLEVSASNSYLIQLGGWNGAQGDGELYIELDVPMPTLFIPEYTFDCDDTGNNLMFVEVEDVNGNAGYGMINIAVYDTTAPMVNIFDLEDYTLYAGETCVDEVDLFAAGQPWYEADDNCEQDVEILYDIINETGIAGCREFDRRWIIQSTDASGNMSSDTTLQHITVMDATGPMVFFDNAPEDLTLELDANCEVDIPEAGTAADSVAVTFTYTLDYWAGEMASIINADDGTIIENIYVDGGSFTSINPLDLYYTVDEATLFDNGYTLIQTINLAPGNYDVVLTDDYGDGWVWNNVDGTDALVISGGADASFDFSGGSEVLGTFTVEEAVTFDMTASATDNCTAMPALSGITYTDGAPEYLCEGGGSYTIARTFTATATDDCGNETVATHVQTITVLDVMAPQITDSEGIMNGETLTDTEAGGIFDFISLPDAIDLEAEDGCSDVTIELVETESGFVPTEDIGNYCGAATPAAFSGGESCSGAAPAAIVLEGAPFNGEAFTIMPGGINIVESYFDQTLHIEIEVTNADGTGGFIWNADYNEAFNWNQWSALGRGYKKDCANVLPGQSPWTQWKYMVMQTGGMIGTGIYAGSELSLTHQPMNYYYGLQVGNGANNQNANYGASAWFYWSGELVLNGASQGFVGSSGDIMLDLDCVMPWAMDFSYTLTDACGNETLFSYGVTNAAAQSGDAAVSGEGSGHQPFDISVAGDVKEPIRITGLQPNPTNNVSQLGFIVSNNMRLRVDLYDMSGQLVQALFDGNAMSDVSYYLTIDAEGLDAGMYQIRISSNAYMAVKKLLVTQ